MTFMLTFWNDKVGWEIFFGKKFAQEKNSV
jgi:hypothetical protein